MEIGNAKWHGTSIGHGKCVCLTLPFVKPFPPLSPSKNCFHDLMPTAVFPVSLLISTQYMQLQCVCHCNHMYVAVVCVYQMYVCIPDVCSCSVCIPDVCSCSVYTRCM